MKNGHVARVIAGNEKNMWQRMAGPARTEAVGEIYGQRLDGGDGSEGESLHVPRLLADFTDSGCPYIQFGVDVRTI